MRLDKMVKKNSPRHLIVSGEGELSTNSLHIGT